MGTHKHPSSTSEQNIMLHYPVLSNEVIESANVTPEELWIDCTLGRGGHCALLLERGAKVIGLDKDPEALHFCKERFAQYGDQFTSYHCDFRHVKSQLTALNIKKVDGIFADLGVSSPQLDTPERGFSFRESGPLDMRMDFTQGLTALEWLKKQDVKSLAYTIKSFGEEPFARSIAQSILKWIESGGIDTKGLANAIEQGIPSSARRKRHKHPATRSFQAIRIAINGELDALSQLLNDGPSLLKPEGKFLLLSFHSLEDRLIKRHFKMLSSIQSAPRRGLPPPPGPPPEYSIHPRKSLTATQSECEQNPRSRSARLRGIKRIRQTL